MSRVVPSVVEQRLLLGRWAGLPQATAMVTLAVDGDADDAVLTRIRTGATALCPGQPLFGVSESDWPDAFLLDDGGAEDPLARWVVAVTVALQRWAGDPVWRGRVLPRQGGHLLVAIPWQREGVFNDTLRLALQLVELWAGTPAEQWPDVNAAIGSGMDAARAEGLGADALRLALAGVERGIPVDRRPGHLQYGWGARLQWLHATVSGRTSYVAAAIAQSKIESTRILADAGLPVPQGFVVGDVDEALRVAETLGWPVVVKPINQEQGRGVVAGIRGEGLLRRAVDAALRFSPGAVVVENHVCGADHRLQVVNGMFIAAHYRRPGGVVGDGVSTVAALLDSLNSDPRRGEDHRTFMKKLRMDAEARECLAEQGLDIHAVPESGRWVPLRRIANVSAGGTSEDVTDTVHPDNRRLAERAARIVGLDIAGVDYLTPDITRSWREVGGAICEVNSYPQLGDPVRDTYGDILDLMFTGGTGRIPVVATTGTGGAPAATLLHRIWSAAGTVTGLCASGMVKVGPEIISTEPFAGLPRAGVVLNDPAVQAAVFELGSAELAALGSPCDRYDVAAVIDPDGPSLELYAAVLGRSETVVVDAADPTAVGLVAPVDPDRCVLISGDPQAPNVLSHLGAGGHAVILDNRAGADWVVVAAGDHHTPVIPVREIASPDLRAALFAAALAWAQGLPPAVIAEALARP